jgi:hypothetical protein
MGRVFMCVACLDRKGLRNRGVDVKVVGVGEANTDVIDKERIGTLNSGAAAYLANRSRDGGVSVNRHSLP